jgi:hypothetical protein
MSELLTHDEQRKIQYQCFKQHGDTLDAIGQTSMYELYDAMCEAQKKKCDKEWELRLNAAVSTAKLLGKP